MAEVRVVRAVEHLGDGLGVGERCRVDPEHGADGIGHHALGLGVVGTSRLFATAPSAASNASTERLGRFGWFWLRLARQVASALRLERFVGAEQPQVERVRRGRPRK